MTTPARLAAYFQLRSSNILVAPLDAAGVHPGRYFVVYRAGPRAELLGRHPNTALLAEQHDLVPDLDRGVRAEDAGVHRDPAQERTTLAPDEDLGPPRERPPVALSIADRHRRRESRGAGPEGQPVGYSITWSQPPDVGYVALENHRGAEPLVPRVPAIAGRVEAVDRHAGTHAVVVGSGVPQGGRRVRGVHQRAAERAGGEDGVEGGDLAPRRPLVTIGRGQVGVDPRELGAQDLARFPHLVRLDAPAVHPRVDLQVDLEAGAGGDATRARQRVRRDDQSELLGEDQPVRQEVGEDQDRSPDPCAPQLGTLLDGHDGKRVSPRLQCCAGNRDRAVAVRVGLHHRHQTRLRSPVFERADVVADSAEIYLGPGPAGGTDAGGRGIQRLLPAGVQDVEGQYVHARDDAAQGPLLCDRQDLDPVLGHQGCGLGEGGIRRDRYYVRRHELVDRHTGALQGLPAV